MYMILDQTSRSLPWLHELSLKVCMPLQRMAVACPSFCDVILEMVVPCITWARPFLSLAIMRLDVCMTLHIVTMAFLLQSPLKYCSGPDCHLSPFCTAQTSLLPFVQEPCVVLRRPFCLITIGLGLDGSVMKLLSAFGNQGTHAPLEDGSTRVVHCLLAHVC